MTANYKIWVLISLLPPIFLTAQKRAVDSLAFLISTATHDTVKLNLELEMEQLKRNMRITYWDSLATRAAKINFYRIQAGAYNNIGYIHSQAGNTGKALAYYEKSQPIWEKLGDPQGIAKLFTNIGAIYDDTGHPLKALQYFEKSIAIQLKSADNNGLAVSYNNIGLIYDNLGDIPKAMDYYSKSLNLREEIGDKRKIATALSNIGIRYAKQGDHEKSADYFTRSLKLMEELGDKKGQAIALNSLGFIYAEQGENVTAVEFYSKSLKLREETGDKRGMATTCHNIASNYLNHHDYDLALEYSLKSLNLREETGDKQGIAISLRTLAQIYIRKSDLQKAMNCAEKSLQISMELGFPEEIKFSYDLLRRIELARDNFSAAEPYAIKVLEADNKAVSLHFSILSEKEQELYLNKIGTDYMKFYSFALIRKKENPEITGLVYNSALRNKGLLLRSAAAMRNIILSSGDTALIAKYNQWIEQKKQLVKSYSGGKEIKALEEKANQLEKDLVRSSVIFNDFDKASGVNWEHVRAKLGKREAAIEFIHFTEDSPGMENGNTLYCALIIQPSAKTPEMIPLCYEKDLEKILKSSASTPLEYINSMYGKNSPSADSLYRLIWKPLEGSLKNIRTIYLSPTGLLHKISFAALGNQNAPPLNGKYDLHIQTSTGKVALPENFMLDKNSVATIFGGIDYNTDSTKIKTWKFLEGTENETAIINSELQDKDFKVNYFHHKSATETEFKKTAPTGNLIHIATHGFFFPKPELVHAKKKDTPKTDEPNLKFRGNGSAAGAWKFVNNKNPLMRSGLVFAGANNVWSDDGVSNDDDGVLTALEITNIDLRKTGLVVLSACETGLGDIKGSEGVYGLQRAFKMAGVKYIIMSLWQVPDKETSEFMTLFYEKLVRIKDIKKAFSQTQSEMRQKYEPYFWAAFVLVE